MAIRRGTPHGAAAVTVLLVSWNLAAGENDEAPGPIPLALSWMESGVVGPASREEVARVLRRSNVSVQWIREPGPRPLGPARAKVDVVVTPSLPEGTGWRLADGAMGVYLTRGASSTVFVFATRVREVLGLPLGNERLPTPAERRDLSRAIARVAVHEIVHRFAPELPHAEEGLMKARLTRKTLTSGRAVIDPRSERALHAALAGAPVGDAIRSAGTR